MQKKICSDESLLLDLSSSVKLRGGEDKLLTTQPHEGAIYHLHVGMRAYCRTGFDLWQRQRHFS